jgi:tellurite resistance protein TerC
MLLIDVYKIPVVWSLSTTLVILAAAVVLSLVIPVRAHGASAYPFGAKEEKPPQEPED